jgi:hypothetical protein
MEIGHLMKCKLSMEAVRNLLYCVEGRTWVVAIGEGRTEEEPIGSGEKMCGLTDECCTVRLISHTTILDVR